jgi:hypothetical protein
MFRDILASFRKISGIEDKGNKIRHFMTLSGMVCGIIRARSVQLPEVARNTPTTEGGYVGRRTHTESQVKRFSRWLKNEDVTHAVFFTPFARLILEALSHSTLVLVIDGTVVARGCMALVIAVVYKQRALPIAWLVEKKKKGHFTEERHLELIEQLKEIIPEGADAVLIGDGEFDGCDLQSVVRHCKWDYVLRTSETNTLCWEDYWFPYKETVSHLKPGEVFVVPDALFTQRGYGPVTGLSWWRKGCDEPLHLVTNMECAQEACHFYAKRFLIETCFSDSKGRGFNLNKSHLSDPERVSRLLMGVFLAYYWIVFLGVTAIREGWQPVIHRKHRCDLSLFQLGLALLDYVITEGLPLPITGDLQLIC